MGPRSLKARRWWCASLSQPYRLWQLCLALLVLLALGSTAHAAGASYVYDAAGRLIIAYDGAGDAALYSYDAAGNLLAIADYPAGTLAAITTSSGSGQPGTSLTIYGTGFCSSPTVTVDGTAASVVSATTTQIVFTIPSGAGSGAVVVSCGGTPVTAGTLAVNSGNLPSITSFTPTLGPTGTAVTVSGSNFQSSADGNDIWFNNSRGTVTTASSSTLGTTVPSYASSGHVTVATQAGTAVSSGYFFVPPGGLTTTQISSTSSTTIGTPVTVTIGTAGQSALVAFDGTAGQPVSLYISGSNFPGCFGVVQVTVTIYNPDGSTLAALTPCLATGIIAGLTLPETGSYTIAVTPSGSNTGHMTLTVYSTPTLTQAIAINGAAVSVSSATPGQNLALTFTGSANEQLALEMTSSTFPGCFGEVQVTISVRTAAGATLASYTPCTASSVFQGNTLPAAGNYQILVTPAGTNTGGMTLKIYDAPTISGTISIGGAPVTVSNSEPGQLIAVTFSGSAGQYVDLNSTNQTLSCAVATILNPDQSTLASQGGGTGCAGVGLFPLERLAQTGTYTITLNTGSTITTGSITLQLLNASSLAATVPISGTYPATVLGDHSLAYWRLDDATGSYTAADAAPKITDGVSGPAAPDTALSLNGYNAYIATTNKVTDPTIYSFEAWFKTTTTSGGKLIGLEGTQTGASASYDRMLYMTNSGQLIFGHWTGSFVDVTSPAAYNDGNWHQAVGTYNGTNLILYVDGSEVASTTGGGPQNFNGWWKMGYGNLVNWPSAPTSYYFQGSLGQIAVWNSTALSATQVANHYGAASGGDYDTTLLGDGPSSYWKLAESSGFSYADAAGSNTGTGQVQAPNGSYQGGVTLDATGVISGDTAVTLDGSTGYLTTALPYADPGPLSLELWFETTTTRGGTLMGFSGSLLGSPSYFDRLLYLTNAGQIVFGTYDTSGHTVKTTGGPYNDGNWHYVVATWASNTLTLYVDGSSGVCSTSCTATGGVQNYTGYWRLGYDNLSGWLSAPSSFYFGGTIDEAAVYPYALSAAQVANHYSAR